MKEKTSGYSQSSYGGYQGQSGGYQSQGNPYGNQQGNPYGEWNPFEDIFGNFGGYYTNGGGQQQQSTTGYEKDTHLRAAGNYVRNGYYQRGKKCLRWNGTSKKKCQMVLLQCSSKPRAWK